MDYLLRFIMLICVRDVLVHKIDSGNFKVGLDQLFERKTLNPARISFQPRVGEDPQ